MRAQLVAHGPLNTNGAALPIETGAELRFSRTLDDHGPPTCTVGRVFQGFLVPSQIRDGAAVIESAGEPELQIGSMSGVYGPGGGFSVNELGSVGANDLKERTSWRRAANSMNVGTRRTA